MLVSPENEGKGGRSLAGGDLKVLRRRGGRLRSGVKRPLPYRRRLLYPLAVKDEVRHIWCQRIPLLLYIA